LGNYTKYSFGANMTLYAKWVEALASIDRTVSGSTQTLYYESIAAAFSAANSGETVKVLKDQTMTESATVASGKTINLNVNLKTISCSSNINMFTVNGTLNTLESYHSSGTSTISNTSGTIFYVSSTGSIRMGAYGDKITSSSGNVINNSGTVSINNLGITSTSSSPAITNTGTLTLNAGTISASNANTIQSTSGTVSITGGTISNSIGNYTSSVGLISVVYVKILLMFLISILL
jgi:hypothetical protein